MGKPVLPPAAFNAILLVILYYGGWWWVWFSEDGRVRDEQRRAKAMTQTITHVVVASIPTDKVEHERNIRNVALFLSFRGSTARDASSSFIQSLSLAMEEKCELWRMINIWELVLNQDSAIGTFVPQHSVGFYRTDKNDGIPMTQAERCWEVSRAAEKWCRNNEALCVAISTPRSQFFHNPSLSILLELSSTLNRQKPHSYRLTTPLLRRFPWMSTGCTIAGLEKALFLTMFVFPVWSPKAETAVTLSVTAKRVEQSFMVMMGWKNAVYLSVVPWSSPLSRNFCQQKFFRPAFFLQMKKNWKTTQ